MEKSVLHKTIFQVRYNPKLKFYDLLTTAAQQLSEYPHWRTNNLNVILRDYDKHCSLTISHNAFSYEQDSNDMDMEVKYIKQALEKLPSALQIKSFNRFGFRRRYLIVVNMSFESLVSILHVKLFSQDDKLRTIMPSQVEDLMYRIDFKEKPYGYHVTVGPVRKGEIPRYIGYDLENHLNPETIEREHQEIKEKYPDVAVFADIDFYQTAEKLSLKETATFTETARQKIQEIINNLNSYLFKTKVGA